ncbi:sensor histidine kinase, partial [Nonomuraea wenchangensis]
ASERRQNLGDHRGRTTRPGGYLERSLATGTAPPSAGVARAAWGLPAVSTPHLPTVLPTVLPAAPAPAEATVPPHQAIEAERARIAGEVHDAAGHGLAAIAMQAGLALVTLDDDPEQTRASLRAIKETSTAALAQLRAALDGIDPPAGDLAALIDGVRAAGLPVDVEPAGLPVPPQLRDTVYRVVRESLTNVLRHAGPTRALVRVTDTPTAYVLEVADRGPGAGHAAEGRGLRGMRARVTEAGGHLTAGPREGGGFQVTARFPHPPDRGQA